MEVVLAIAILSIGLLGVAKLFAGSLNRTFENRDDIIAAGLVQEGIELVRNKRDNNVLADPNDPFSGISPTCNLGYRQTSCISGSTGLVLNGSGFYEQTSGASKFRRIIKTGGSGDTITVTAYVSWDGQDPLATAAECDALNTPPERCVYSSTTLSSWQ